MKSVYLLATLCVLLPSACIPVELPARQSNRVVQERPDNANEHILHIGFNPKIGDTAIIQAAEKYSATVIRRTANTVSVRLPKGSNVNRGINHFKNVRGVQTIDLEKVYRIQ
ncbi:MAG: hypothetical protein IKI11_04540 [Neisseriaceae bacterium]|nr:hypothetical protein [Neisseriaceae bacterium]